MTVISIGLKVLPDDSSLPEDDMTLESSGNPLFIKSFIWTTGKLFGNPVPLQQILTTYIILVATLPEFHPLFIKVLPSLILVLMLHQRIGNKVVKS